MTRLEDREAGYTLVETLVAFAILAGALVITFASFGAGVRNMAEVEHRRMLTELARSEISRLALRPFLQVEAIQGDSGSVRWQLVVRPIGDMSEQSSSSSHPFLVTFNELSGKNRPAPVLETILLAPEAER